MEETERELAEGYANFFGTPKCDFENALIHFEKAAELGNSRAQYITGECYFDGIGCVQDNIKGRQFNELAASQNHPLAKLAAFVRKPTPLSSTNSRKELAILKEKVVEIVQKEDDAFAYYLLGLCDIFEIPHSYALQHFTKAAKLGHISAMYHAGIRDDTHAVGYLTEASLRGHAPSQCVLGSLYKLGKLVEKDYAIAKRWYEISARNGCISAQHNLGIFLLQGTGGEKDIPQAIQLLKNAADRDFGPSAFVVGRHLQKEGFPEQAVKYFTIAADQSYPHACYLLADCLEKGIGTSMDWNKAIKLFRIAAERSFCLAAHRYRKLVNRRKAWKFIRFLWIGWYKDKEHCVFSKLPRDLIREISHHIRMQT